MSDASETSSRRRSWLPPQVKALADREREIASIIYRRGASTAIDIETRLSSKITNAAVRSMLVRLTKKGILHRERGMRGRGQQCIYLPAITLSQVRERALQELASRYFDGSLLNLAMQALDLVDAKSHTASPLVASLAPRRGAPEEPQPPVGIAA